MEPDLHQLRALSAAVSEGTLDGAARVLHVTPSAISQRLKALETATGRVLLVRSKPVRVTPSGRAVLRLARQVELLAADTAAELDLADGDPGFVTLPVAVNADSLATWFLPALAPLSGELCFQLYREDEDRTSELLREGAVVGAVTADAEPVAGCSIVALGAMRYRAMAAPAYAARWFPDGPHPDAFAVAPIVSFDRDDQLQQRFLARRGTGPVAPRPTRSRRRRTSSPRSGSGSVGGWCRTSSPATSSRADRWSTSTPPRRSTSRSTGSSGGCGPRPSTAWRRP